MCLCVCHPNRPSDLANGCSAVRGAKVASVYLPTLCVCVCECLRLCAGLFVCLCSCVCIFATWGKEGVQHMYALSRTSVRSQSGFNL